MSSWIIGAAASWLVELYLLASVVLVAASVAMRTSRQPARRLAVARAALVSLAMLGPIVAAARAARALRDDSGTPAPAPAVVPAAVPAVVSVFCCPEGAVAAGPPAPAGTAPAVTIAFVAFAAGSSGVLAWLGLGAMASIRLAVGSRPAPDRLERILGRVVDEGGRPPRLVISRRVVHPVAAGFFRPAIVLPPRFAAVEPEGRIEAALAHEWTHIKNGDLRLLSLGRLLLPLFFAHPLYGELRRRMHADQEALADAAAAGSQGPIAYAEALVLWSRAGRVRTSNTMAPGLGLWGRPSTLTGRIALLLDRDFHVEPLCPRLWRLAVRGVAVVMIAALGLVSITGALDASLATGRSMQGLAPRAPHVHGVSSVSHLAANCEICRCAK